MRSANPSAHAVASAKINLSLRVLGVRDDGYHEISTVFHAVSLSDELRIGPGAPGTGCSVHTTGERIESVPSGEGNIAARAVRELARVAGIDQVDAVIDITKAIPVAAGMAGGSADAAAALVAARAMWGVTIDDEELQAIAAELGSDVPFALVGGTARGVGRGEVLAPVLSTSSLHWVIAVSEGELSTPSVYAEWDRLVEVGVCRPSEDTDDRPLLAALRGGEPSDIAPHLVNDLQPAAISLRPSLTDVLAAGTELGALAGLVSGSGPTCVFLAADRDEAIGLVAELSGLGLVRAVRYAVGPAPGARIVP